VEFLYPVWDLNPESGTASLVAALWQYGRGRRHLDENEDTPMNAPTQEELTQKRCVACEGGVPPLSREQAEATARNVEGWTLDPDGKRISRSWTVRNFMAGIDFFNKVAALAEEEGHHPDLHLEGYRNLTITLWTHAVNGLTENDFILAAKINQVPVQLRR
jgi:4a-hydroxytetrahydrobiopterin dehydratase